MSNAKVQASQKEVPQFRMGTEEKYQKNVSIKTKLIKKAGGYGGFQRQYSKNPFTTTREDAKKLIQRNQECFCGSKKKYKRCFLRLDGS